MAEEQNTVPAVSADRLPFFDVLRGVALVAMTIYHFTWDLEFFGYLLPATTLQTGWVIFARSIAFSFLFLVGVSLFLAHGNGIRWRSFLKRLLQIVVAALAITVATYFAFPQSFIFFGILHGIALFSVITLAFLRAPWFVTAAAALIIWLVWRLVWVDLFAHPVFWWIGLMPEPPLSNDYVPLFPWAGATLLGLAFAQLLARIGWLRPIGSVSPPAPVERPLSFIGRHSLIYYLLHQPVMLGLLWVVTAVAGPPDRTPVFLHLCTTQCVANNSEAFCTPYCSCVADGFKREKIFTPFFEGQIEISSNDQAKTVIRQCTLDQE